MTAWQSWFPVSYGKASPCFHLERAGKKRMLKFGFGLCRCIGSIQHLKGKFGRGYSLEINLREELTGLQQVALLHEEIMKIFPHAVRQDR